MVTNITAFTRCQYKTQQLYSAGKLSYQNYQFYQIFKHSVPGWTIWSGLEQSVTNITAFTRCQYKTPQLYSLLENSPTEITNFTRYSSTLYQVGPCDLSWNSQLPILPLVPDVNIRHHSYTLCWKTLLPKLPILPDIQALHTRFDHMIWAGTINYQYYRFYQMSI